MATPSATAATTPTAVTQQLFSLDAARVSKLHNAGDLSGLTAVRPGSHVWLMIYYTLHALPRKESRVATYDVISGSNKLLYRIVYRQTEKKGANGRVVKYSVYHFPSTLPLGTYHFRATLEVAGKTQVKQWKFQLAPHDHVVYHTGDN